MSKSARSFAAKIASSYRVTQGKSGMMPFRLPAALGAPESLVKDVGEVICIGGDEWKPWVIAAMTDAVGTAFHSNDAPLREAAIEACDCVLLEVRLTSSMDSI